MNEYLQGVCGTFGKLVTKLNNSNIFLLVVERSASLQEIVRRNREGTQNKETQVRVSELGIFSSSRGFGARRMQEVVMPNLME